MSSSSPPKAGGELTVTSILHWPPVPGRIVQVSTLSALAVPDVRVRAVTVPATSRQPADAATAIRLLLSMVKSLRRSWLPTCPTRRATTTDRFTANSHEVWQFRLSKDQGRLHCWSRASMHASTTACLPLLTEYAGS